MFHVKLRSIWESKCIEYQSVLLIEANNYSDEKALRLISRSAVDKGDGAIRIKSTIEPTSITNSILEGKQLLVSRSWPDYEANKNF